MSSPPTPHSEEALFSEALQRPRDQRADYLARACGEDRALRARVTALLHSHDAAGELLDSGPGVSVRAALSSSRPSEERPGSMIGRYRLRQKIGEGGCGVVYMAEQQAPVERRVALKIIKLGMATTEVIARFEAERQALAMMDHPNIAKVFDAGATDTGRPYFVMELVRGVKITDYCDQQNLSTTERLNLFIQVCHAIQHAHQKGVIHRDIKPSNILVTLQDGEPVPKVIDFGIAKATQGRLTDRTLFTAFEQFIGTPAYMSPEQAQMSSEDVDTRSDIYSLGVLLYELLTSRTPFESNELLKAGLDEMRRQIREVEPLRPSTRLRTLEADAMTATAQHRATVPPRLLHLVRGDLDWIVMRCLDKNRLRRYATANELASDLERHLRDEPVVARPPTTGYLLCRLVRRHRTAVAAGAAILSVFVLAAVISTLLAIRATRAEHRMQRVMQVFTQVLDGMGQTAALGPSTNLDQGSREWRQILDVTARKVTSTLRDQPEVEAEVRHVFGKIYMVSASYPQAEAMLRASLALRRAHLGAEHPDTVQTIYDLGLTVWASDHASDRFYEAEALVAEALAARRKTLGPDYPETVKALEILAFGIWIHGDSLRAEPLFREAVESRRRTGRLEVLDNAALSPLQGLTQCLLSLSRFQEGELLARENVALVTEKLGAQHPLVSRANLLMGWALNGQRKHAEALPFCRTGLAINRATLEPDHPELSHSIYELAGCLDSLGRAGDQAEAEQLYREALVTWRSRRASSDPNNMIYRLTSFGTFLAKQNRFKEGADQFDEAWNILIACDRPTCVQHQASTIKQAIELYTKWNRLDPAKTTEVARWLQRLDQFEQKTIVEPAGPHRTGAVLGLAAMYAEWVKVDPTKEERAIFWSQQLKDCNRAVQVKREPTHNSSTQN